MILLEKKENISVIRDYDPSLPELTYDSDQIEQALLNIAKNALQILTPEGGTLTFRTRTAFQVILQGNCCRLCARIDIQYDGPGIASHLKDIIFYPMVSGREEGSGLGLPIARNLIDKHRGKIDYESWPKHTLFSVYLPIKW